MTRLVLGDACVREAAAREGATLCSLPVFKTDSSFTEEHQSMVISLPCFEKLNFKYWPWSSHDVNELIKNAPETCKRPKRCSVLHIMTKKGKGYRPAGKINWLPRRHKAGILCHLKRACLKAPALSRRNSPDFGDFL
ncbi:hypothetical protein OK016_05045 [Vibrio chagasii]|nr:hypothetical protein [Vibrio chagasii]